MARPGGCLLEVHGRAIYYLSPPAPLFPLRQSATGLSIIRFAMKRTASVSPDLALKPRQILATAAYLESGRARGRKQITIGRLSTQRARRLGISKEESTGHLGNLIHLATRRIAIEHAILRTVPTADRVRSRTGTTPAERRDHSSCVVFASDGELQRIQRQNQTQVISGQGQPVVTAACHYRVSLM